MAQVGREPHLPVLRLNTRAIMSMSESLRKKLQMLRRTLAREDTDSAAQMLRRVDTAARDDDTRPASIGPIPLADACPGEEAAATDGARFWMIRRTLAEVSPTETAIAAEYAAVIRGARQRFDELQAPPALCFAANAQPEDILFMDTETCGFSGSMIFLVGLMSYRDEGLVFEQLLARDYSEEAAILRSFAMQLATAGVLVTFNGKAFDMNMIRERSAFHAVQLPPDQPPHLDLLHACRRRWRSQLPNCRLGTLEQHFCGRTRSGDIPGADIPDAYHSFVRSGDARGVRDIVHHNLLDLLTMAQLLSAILTGCDPAT